MTKASSKIILLLAFPILLICLQGHSELRGNNSAKSTQKPPVKVPDTIQLETQLKNTDAAVAGVQGQIQKLTEEVNKLAGAQSATLHLANLGVASRLENYWVMLTGASLLAVLVGGIFGVFLGPLFRRRLESSQHEELLDLSNKTEGLNKQADNLNDRLGLLEERVQDIYESLLIKGDSETVQPDEEAATPILGDSAPLPKDDRPIHLTVTESGNGQLAHIGVVPPSEYLAAIQSSSMTCKTTTTKQDFRYPGKLIESEGGRFLILSVKDGTNLYNLALPTSDRLLGSDEFTYYYKSIFDCEQPVSGEIYVIAPATMDEDTQQGGWVLHSRGKLQIRR